jgi:hypothetical protein
LNAIKLARIFRSTYLVALMQLYAPFSVRELDVLKLNALMHLKQDFWRNLAI